MVAALHKRVAMCYKKVVGDKKAVNLQSLIVHKL